MPKANKGLKRYWPNILKFFLKEKENNPWHFLILFCFKMKILVPVFPFGDRMLSIHTITPQLIDMRWIVFDYVYMIYILCINLEEYSYNTMSYLDESEATTSPGLYWS